MTDIHEIVYSFKTKFGEGFTNDEVEEILKKYPSINMDQFNNALMGVTGIVRGKEFITYHCDIETAIRCGIENRGLKFHEFD